MRIKLNQMKITNNNIELFERLGNIFPNLNDLKDCFSVVPTRTKELLIRISNGDINSETTHENIEDSFLLNYLSKSYTKKLSSFIDLLLLNYGVVINNDYYILSDYINIGKLIDSKYYRKWSKLLDTFNLKYNAIRPYDINISDTMEENTENDVNIKRATESSSDSKTTEIVDNDETQNSIYGFNSINAVPSDISTNKSQSNNNSNDKFESSGSSDTEQTKKITNDRNITRQGNIGNITQQELIERERELLQYQIIDTVYNDLDKIFTCGSY